MRLKPILSALQDERSNQSASVPHINLLSSMLVFGSGGPRILEQEGQISEIQAKATNTL